MVVQLSSMIFSIQSDYNFHFNWQTAFDLLSTSTWLLPLTRYYHLIIYCTTIFFYRIRLIMLCWAPHPNLLPWFWHILIRQAISPVIILVFLLCWGHIITTFGVVGYSSSTTGTISSISFLPLLGELLALVWRGIMSPLCGGFWRSLCSAPLGIDDELVLGSETCFTRFYNVGWNWLVSNVCAATAYCKWTPQVQG